MRFDPAIAAQRAFAWANVTGELGSDWEEAERAGATFSSVAERMRSSERHAFLNLNLDLNLQPKVNHSRH